MKDFKGKELNIGDRVIFCIGDNKLDEGTIINNFYKGYWGEDACTIKTKTKTFRNIYSARIYKLED